MKAKRNCSKFDVIVVKNSDFVSTTDSEQVSQTTTKKGIPRELVLFGWILGGCEL